MRTKQPPTTHQRPIQRLDNEWELKLYLVMVNLQPSLTWLPPAGMRLQARLPTHHNTSSTLRTVFLSPKATHIYSTLHTSALQAHRASSLRCWHYIPNHRQQQLRVIKASPRIQISKHPRMWNKSAGPQSQIVGVNMAMLG